MTTKEKITRLYELAMELRRLRWGEWDEAADRRRKEINDEMEDLYTPDVVDELKRRQGEE